MALLTLLEGEEATYFGKYRRDMNNITHGKTYRFGNIIKVLVVILEKPKDYNAFLPHISEGKEEIYRTTCTYIFC